MSESERLLAVIRDCGAAPLWWACYLAGVPRAQAEARLANATLAEPRLWQERCDDAGGLDPAGEWWVGVI